MTATPLPPPPYAQPVQEGGRLTQAWMVWFRKLYDRTGGASDKVEAAHALAAGATPRTTQVLGVGGLQVGGALSDHVAVALYRTMAVVASLPLAGNAEGDWAWALDGRKPGEGAAAGTGVPCFWSNGQWIAATSGAAVTA